MHSEHEQAPLVHQEQIQLWRSLARLPEEFRDPELHTAILYKAEAVHNFVVDLRPLMSYPSHKRREEDLAMLSAFRREAWLELLGDKEELFISDPVFEQAMDQGRDVQEDGSDLRWRLTGLH